ncbi:MAG: hypothetical protein AABY32_05280 [Nanoarchaeota archaeon]
MAKSKLKTPDWILKGKEKPNKQKEGKTFKIRECPKCKSDEVKVLLTGEERKNRGEWECRKCGWTGKNIVERELGEDELMEHLDKKGVEVA